MQKGSVQGVYCGGVYFSKRLEAKSRIRVWLNKSWHICVMEYCAKKERSHKYIYEQ